jgi:hypothetical protein
VGTATHRERARAAARPYQPGDPGSRYTGHPPAVFASDRQAEQYDLTKDDKTPERGSEKDKSPEQGQEQTEQHPDQGWVSKLRGWASSSGKKPSGWEKNPDDGDGDSPADPADDDPDKNPERPPIQ